MVCIWMLNLLLLLVDEQGNWNGKDSTIFKEERLQLYIIVKLLPPWMLLVRSREPMDVYVDTFRKGIMVGHYEKIFWKPILHGGEGDD